MDELRIRIRDRLLLESGLSPALKQTCFTHDFRDALIRCDTEEQMRELIALREKFVRDVIKGGSKAINISDYIANSVKKWKLFEDRFLKTLSEGKAFDKDDKSSPVEEKRS